MNAGARYETGVYADEVLQHYFPPALAVISNIAAGRRRGVATRPIADVDRICSLHEPPVPALTTVIAGPAPSAATR